MFLKIVLKYDKIITKLMGWTMKYIIYGSTSKHKDMTKRYEYSTREEAEEQVERMRTKYVKIVEIPDLREGYILKKQGEIFGIIEKETDYTYFINKPDKDDDLLTPFCKENMEKYFLEEHFDPVEEYI